MCLQQFLKKQTQTNDPLRMCVDFGQPMTVPYVECPKRKVQRHRVVVEVTKGGSKQTNPVEWNVPARWAVACFWFGRMVRMDEIVDLGVT